MTTVCTGTRLVGVMSTGTWLPYLAHCRTDWCLLDQRHSVYWTHSSSTTHHHPGVAILAIKSVVRFGQPREEPKRLATADRIHRVISPQGGDRGAIRAALACFGTTRGRPSRLELAEALAFTAVMQQPELYDALRAQTYMRYSLDAAERQS